MLVRAPRTTRRHGQIADWWVVTWLDTHASVCVSRIQLGSLGSTCRERIASIDRVESVSIAHPIGPGFNMRDRCEPYSIVSRYRATVILILPIVALLVHMRGERETNV
jgi:hypothetical protein